MIRILISLSLLALFSGCASIPESPRLDPTRSHLTEKQAEFLAVRNAIFIGGQATQVKGTGSMGNTFYPGQWVVIVKNWSGILEGYIINFDQKDKSIIHRTIRLQDGQWLTNGDRKDNPIWVREENYTGTLVQKFYHQVGMGDE